MGNYLKTPIRRSVPTPGRGGLTPDSSVARACKAVVRLIHADGLEAGAQLPTQPELRRRFGFANHTLSEAMATLAARGVLTRKQRIGTIVADPSRAGGDLWSVGLATMLPPLGAASFHADLTHRIQYQLLAAGCRVQTHILPSPDINHLPGLGDYTDLLDAADRGQVDCIMSLVVPVDRWGATPDLPVVHATYWETHPSAVLIDQQAYVEDAITLALAAGCRRPVVVGKGLPILDGQARFWQGLCRAMGTAGLPVDATNLLACPLGLPGGHAAAVALLAMPPEERPDALVVLDDWVGLGLTSVLADASDYRPLIAVQTNSQVPLAFHLPTHRFDVDIEQLATLSAAMLLEIMVQPSRPLRQDWVVPRLLSHEVGQVPAACPPPPKGEVSHVRTTSQLPSGASLAPTH